MSEIERPDRAIPANIEAERAVLGSLMIDPDAIIKVANFLRPEDFFRERHAWLYEAMRTLNERREPLDFVTIVDELERRERLEEIGGPAYLTDLIASTPTALYVDHYARIVERTAVLRRLIAAAGKIAELAYDESQEVDEVVDRAEQIIFGISESRIHRDLTPIRAIMSQVVDRIDFLSRNQDTLMGVPTGFTMLDRLLGGLQKSDLIILAARPAMGKCVAAGTRLLNPRTGELTPIETLVQARHAPLLTLNADYKLTTTEASDFIDDGMKPVYLVRTALGREIKVTLTHPFLTIEGWRPLGELQVGDTIAVPRTLPVFGTIDIPEQHAKLLGYFLADGCLRHTNPQFTNSNPRLRDDFAAAIAYFPGVKVRYEDSQGKRTPTLYVSSDRDNVRRERANFAQTLQQQFAQRNLSVPAVAEAIAVDHAIIRFWLKGETVPSATVLPKVAQLLQVSLEQLAPSGLSTLRRESQNSVTRWLQQQGIWGKGAADKFVPEEVFTYTKPKVALFLNRLFACDGSLYVQNQQQAGVTYRTVSKQFAHDVQHLLLRFGIIAKLRHRQVKYNDSRCTAYELRITDTASIQRFCTEIGAFGKEEALARVLTQVENSNGHGNRDLIPVAIWEQISAKKGEQSWRSLHQKMGLSLDHNLHVGKRAPSRRRLRQIGEALADPSLIALAESDLYWDEITAIDYLGEQQVYDLTVPETHNFIADDMLVHNTSFCLSIAQNAAKRHATRVAFFSLEMSNDQLVQRLLAMETGIDSHRLRLGNIHEEEWPILLEAANMLANTHIFIDDTPAASVNDIRTKARRLYAEDGIDLIIIDYMQLMTGQSGGSGRNENRQQEISYISRSLKTLARELNVPVIALSQLSRAVESRSDKRPMLSDLRESGCLTGETLITLANGQRQPIASLAGQSDFEVFSLNTKTWKLEKATVSQAFCTGMKPVYKLTTALGRTIRATANHQFLTIHGWKRLDELQPNERIALPREIKISACPTMTEAELALLGHLIGDGCTLPRHAIQYTTREHDLACTVAELATKVFGNDVAPRIKQERTWYQVYLSSTRRHTHGVRSVVAEWLDELSVWGLKSYEKFVPEKVFQQPAESIAVFLRHLWVTDGSIKLVKGQHVRPIAFYASSSQRLARDVQTLLMRLGINSTVKQFSQSGKGRDQFHVTVTGKEDIGQFVNRIGTIGQYKSEAVTEIVAYNAERKHNTNRDVIPSDIWEILVKPQMKQTQLTHRLLHERLGMSYAGMTIFKQNVSRNRALRVAEAIQSNELKLLAESDVYWDLVVRIEADGAEPVYDLTVPGNHNFIANDIVVHNSIEQDADVVLFIYREDYYIEDTDRQNIADILVTKHRHGATGTVSLYFRKELTQFRDLEIQRTELEY